MSKRIAILLLLALTLASGTQAQQPDRLVSTKVSKTIAPTPGDIFSITGEKATVILSGWDKDYIGLKIVFSAEHADRSIAEKELQYMHYSLSREKNTIELRNAFILPSRTDRLQSRVKVVMELMVPRDMPLLVNSKYGNTAISDLSGKISITLEFSDLNLSNVSGEVEIRSSYSEVRGEQLAISSFKADDEETKYILSLDKGSYSFNSRHGDLDLTIASIQSLVIDATHTDITIQPKTFDAYNYQLFSREGSIYVPVGLGDLVKKQNNHSQVTLSQQREQPLVRITTTFNAITIQ